MIWTVIIPCTFSTAPPNREHRPNTMPQATMNTFCYAQKLLTGKGPCQEILIRSNYLEEQCRLHILLHFSFILNLTWNLSMLDWHSTVQGWTKLTVGGSMGSEKQPWFFPHIWEVRPGQQMSAHSATEEAVSTTYTGGQWREETNKSTWSRAFSPLTMYFEPHTTWGKKKRLITKSQNKTENLWKKI